MGCSDQSLEWRALFFWFWGLGPEVHYRNNFDGKMLWLMFPSKLLREDGGSRTPNLNLVQPTLEVFRYLSDWTRTLLTYLGTRILKEACDEVPSMQVRGRESLCLAWLMLRAHHHHERVKKFFFQVCTIAKPHTCVCVGVLCLSLVRVCWLKETERSLLEKKCNLAGCSRWLNLHIIECESGDRFHFWVQSAYRGIWPVLVVFTFDCK